MRSLRLAREDVKDFFEQVQKGEQEPGYSSTLLRLPAAPAACSGFAGLAVCVIVARPKPYRRRN
jgi:hypothetical protein